MGYYESALDWAKLILQGLSPVSGVGKHHAPSLLFPMEAVFEAYVEKHLARQLRVDFVLKAHASSQHLVAHDDQRWFRLKPDLLVKQKQSTRLVLDTKWKLLDAAKKNGREKYQLSQADFYQLKVKSTMAARRNSVSVASAGQYRSVAASAVDPTRQWQATESNVSEIDRIWTPSEDMSTN